ncbi:ScyD/ScyE family protein [Segetibacter koreensis]|uniref:ScyD/ScyE family protein n=1 Tax=Segetibacter koreensis TaxID=398037 RepID=UPI00037B438E|nr:ScyD/ScyE family protein [Segetibacter koreensis]
MKTKITWHFAVITATALLLTSCHKQLECDSNAPLATVKLFATGLNNPRGLKFGPDGNLYVAEGGIGGTSSSGKQCMQVPAPVGPYKGSTTGGRISWINSNGERKTLSDQFPSSINNLGDISGVGDVAFIDNSLYALITGAGCSHGVPKIPNGIVRVNANGKLTSIANLSKFIQDHPVKHPEADDFEPDGDWYSMINVEGNFYAIEANHGELDKITPDGNISRIIDISASQGHIVPTVVTYHKGNFYVGNLHPFPIKDGSSSIYKITPSGNISVWATGFTTILGIAFDKQDRLYVLQNTTGNQFPTPGAGSIVRLNPSGAKEIITSSLSLPTGLTIGPDDKLYVSNIGFGPIAIGGGEILQISLRNCLCDTNFKLDGLK